MIKSSNYWILLLFLLSSLTVQIGCGGKKDAVSENSSQEGDSTSEEQASISDLLDQLKDKKLSKRLAAQTELVTLIKEDPQKINELIEGLKNSYGVDSKLYYPGQLQSIREAIVQTLMQIGKDGQNALQKQGLPILKEGLKDKKPAVRQQTAYAIALMKSKARPIADSIMPLLSDPDPKVRVAGYAALEAAGTANEKEFIKLFTNPNLDMVSDAAEALSWFHPQDPASIPVLLEALAKPWDVDEPEQLKIVYSIRNAIADSIASFSPPAKEAIPKLIEVLKNTTLNEIESSLRRAKTATESFETGAMHALRKLGSASVEALIPLLKDSNFLVRWQVAKILGGIGPDAKAALPSLQTALDSEKQSFDVVAATALAQVQIGGSIDKSMPRLMELLKDKNGNIRLAAAEVLEYLGPVAKSALPIVIGLLNDPEEGIKSQAIAVLIAFGPEAKPAIPALIQKLKDEDITIQQEALEALGGLGKFASSAVPELIPLLKSKNSRTQESALKSIASIGPDAKQALPALIDLLKQEVTVADSQIPVFDTIAAMGSEAASAGPVFLPYLLDKKPYIRQKVLAVLAQIRTRDKGVIEQINQLALKDSNMGVRISAVKCLAIIGANSPEAKETLKAMVQKKLNEEAVWAAAALVHLRIDTESNRTTIENILKNPRTTDRFIFLAAMDSVSLMGSEAKRSIPALTALLKDKILISKEPKVQLRQKAALTLGELGKTAEETIPAIANLLLDPDLNIRRSALQALAKFGPVAIQILPKLQELERTEPALLKETRNAIRKIDPKD